MLKSNVYMDAAGKKPNFRTAKSEFDRKRMEMAAKQWIKKKQPSFDGDVYGKCEVCPESDRGRKGKEEMQSKWRRNYGTDFQ